MNVNAFISGRARAALIVDGEQCRLLRDDSPEQLEPWARESWNFLFGDVDDLQFVSHQPPDAIRRLLEDAVDFTESLDVLLYLLDANWPADVRRAAAEELNDLLAYSEIAEFLESILSAKPLTDEADLAGAQSACAGCVRVADFLSTLAERQSAIRMVRWAWDATAEEIFEDRCTAQVTEGALVRAGDFARFVMDTAAGIAPDPSGRQLQSSSVLLPIPTSTQSLLVGKWSTRIRVQLLLQQADKQAAESIGTHASADRVPEPLAVRWEQEGEGHDLDVAYAQAVIERLLNVSDDTWPVLNRVQLRALITALRHAKSPRLRIKVAESLAHFGRHNDDVKAALSLACRSDPSDRVRDRARYALERCTQPRHEPLLSGRAGGGS